MGRMKDLLLDDGCVGSEGCEGKCKNCCATVSYSRYGYEDEYGWIDWDNPWYSTCDKCGYTSKTWDRPDKVIQVSS